MREVAIIGLGQTTVGEHWEKSISDLALESTLAALRDAGVERVDALYVGNMLSGELTGQAHLGAAVAEAAGLVGTEAFKIEAACGSGAAALRIGYIAVGSGISDVVVVVGVEKLTDKPGAAVTACLAGAADADYEAQSGISFVALNALMMRRYMHEYGLRHEDFAPFAVNAHANAVQNRYAMFRSPVTATDFRNARMVADPVNLLDSPPVCDGSAALVLCPADIASRFQSRPVRILASCVATDTLALHSRRDPLYLKAAAVSSSRALKEARVRAADIDFFELHDAFTIMSVLSLEACGFAERGQGIRLGLDGDIAIDGRIPIATMGGLKARGHPVGATGVYQIVEAVQQLRGEAGKNQVAEARLGMTQNIGGSGATVTTTILEGPE